MYASVRRYRIEGAIDVISRLSGFRAYFLVKDGDGSIASLSLFSDRNAAMQSNETAARWVAENAADLLGDTVDTVTGEVIAYA